MKIIVQSGDPKENLWRSVLKAFTKNTIELNTEQVFYPKFNYRTSDLYYLPVEVVENFQYLLEKHFPDSEKELIKTHKEKPIKNISLAEIIKEYKQDYGELADALLFFQALQMDILKRTRKDVKITELLAYHRDFFSGRSLLGSLQISDEHKHIFDDYVKDSKIIPVSPIRKVKNNWWKVAVVLVMLGLSGYGFVWVRSLYQSSLLIYNREKNVLKKGEDVSTALLGNWWSYNNTYHADMKDKPYIRIAWRFQDSLGYISAHRLYSQKVYNGWCESHYEKKHLHILLNVYKPNDEDSWAFDILFVLILLGS